MLLRLGYDIIFEFAVPTPMVLLLNTSPQEAHRLLKPDFPQSDPFVPMTEYIDGFGNRCHRLVAPKGQFRLFNDTLATDTGLPDVMVMDAPQHPVEELPDNCLQFLLGSRYCEVGELTPIAWDLFGETPPTAERVQTICDWVFSNVEFGYKYARPTKTALDVFQERRGVCRDFTHLAVTLCRCMNIPTRYCNGYMGDIGVPPDVNPMDFNAWMEVYLGGQWRMYDPRHNTPRIGRVVLARGRDAVDVAMTTAFGFNKLVKFVVITEEAAEQEATD